MPGSKGLARRLEGGDGMREHLIAVDKRDDAAMAAGVLETLSGLNKTVTIDPVRNPDGSLSYQLYAEVSAMEARRLIGFYQGWSAASATNGQAAALPAVLKKAMELKWI